MRESLLDTDTLSAIIKGQDRMALVKAARYLSQYGSFAFSLITRYEILRGLKARDAAAQIAAFEIRCRVSEVLPVRDSIMMKAAELYPILRLQGAPLGDADLIIAATALMHDLTLVTTRTGDFSRVPGLVVDCWTGQE